MKKTKQGKINTKHTVWREKKVREGKVRAKSYAERDEKKKVLMQTRIKKVVPSGWHPAELIPQRKKGKGQRDFFLINQDNRQQTTPPTTESLCKCKSLDGFVMVFHHSIRTVNKTLLYTVWEDVDVFYLKKHNIFNKSNQFLLQFIAKQLWEELYFFSQNYLKHIFNIIYNLSLTDE